MTFSLFEWLKAVGLQQYYARFTSMGVCKADHISGLCLDDYSLLGIRSVEHRTRLFHLVQLVKHLDPKNFANDDPQMYNEGDESNFAMDDSNPDRDENLNNRDKNGFARHLQVQRRLDFSDEPAVLRQRLIAHPAVRTLTGCNRKSQSQVEKTKKQTIKEENSSFKLNARLSEKGVTLKSPKLNPATFVQKTFINRPFKYKERNFSTSKRCAIDITELVPVYEAKRTNGYNYGLPLSLTHVSNKIRQMGGQRISVCVRKKPLTNAESRGGESDVVTTPGGECVVVHESKEAVDLTKYKLQHKFYFDQVFGEESTNEDVYEKAALPLVQHMLRGGKATCFAYGQTGAGKTHTMLGSPGKPGLYTLAVRDIFAHLSTTNKFPSPLVYVSFFEIYCGQLYDLLDHRKRLFAREDGNNVVHITRLRDVQVNSVNSLLEVISQGTAERTQGMSGTNPFSSRSHALLQIQLRDPNQQLTGRMWFVDLAGSERATDAKKTNRQSRIEGAEINQSLLALKECIRSLDREESHTPFRQSKLTLVLKDSFVGDSMTCMIANISSGHQATEHTLNTLRYADRVKELKGEGGSKGKIGCKGMPSPKHPQSKSSCIATRTPKNVEPRKQTKIFGCNTPTKLHASPKFFHSNSKKNECKEEMQEVSRQSIGQMTPVKVGPGLDDKILSRTETRRVIHNCYETNHSECESGRNCRPMLERANTSLQKQDEASKACLAVPERGSGFLHKIKETKTLEPKWIETKQHMQSNGSMSSFQFKADEIEKKRHLRRYHQQLQQFTPTSASSSAHFPLSSTYPPSLQNFAHLSVSDQVNLSSEDTLGTRRLTGVNLNSKQIPSYRAGTPKLQTEPSSNHCISEDDIHSGEKDEDRRVSSQGFEESLNRDFSQNVRKAQNKEKNEEEVKKCYGRPDVTVRKCAWVSTTETKPTDRRMSQTSSGTQLSQICSLEGRKEEELDFLDAPRDAVWRIKQKEPADCYSLESTHIGDDSFREPLFGSQHQQAATEKPFSPTFEETLTPRSFRVASVKTNQLRRIHTLPLQNTTKNIKLKKRTPCPVTDQSTSLPATVNLSTSRFAFADSLNNPSESVREYKHPEIVSKISVEEKALRSTFGYCINPINLSQAQVDQQCAPSFFLQENDSKTPVSSSKREDGDRNSKTEREEHSNIKTKEETMEDEDAELCFSFLKLPQQQVFHHIGAKSVKIDLQNNKVYITGTNNRPISGFIPVPKEENCQVKQTESTLNQKLNAPPPISAPFASVHTPLIPSHIGSSTNENPPEYPPSITTQQSKSSSTQSNILFSEQSSNSNCPNNPGELGWQDRFSHQEIIPTAHLLTMNDLSHAKLCILKAHLDQLKEMEALCQKEKKLLSQQYDMALWDYVNKLSEIMERKVKCAQSIKVQLQTYLKPIHSMSSQNQIANNHDPVM